MENQDVNAMMDCLSALDILDLGGIAYGKAVKVSCPETGNGTDSAQL